jgi:Acyl-CoA dehydrogenase, N-terminal domain
MTIDTLVEDLRPTIEQHREEADRLGRLPDQLVAQLREAGAFRLHLPRELGGAELSLRATLELLDGLGRIDGATVWTVWNLNMGLVTTMLPPSGVAKLGPDWLMANSTSPGTAVPDGDGYRLSGEWKIVSGAHAAEWFLLNSIVMRDGQPSIVDGQPELRSRHIRDFAAIRGRGWPGSSPSCWWPKVSPARSFLARIVTALGPPGNEVGDHRDRRGRRPAAGLVPVRHLVGLIHPADTQPAQRLGLPGLRVVPHPRHPGQRGIAP